MGATVMQGQCHNAQVSYLDATSWRELKALHVLGCCRLLGSLLGPIARLAAFPLVATTLVIAPSSTAAVLLA